MTFCYPQISHYHSQIIGPKNTLINIILTSTLKFSPQKIIVFRIRDFGQVIALPSTLVESHPEIAQLSDMEIQFRSTIHMTI